MKFWMNPIFSMVLTAIVLTATGCSGSDGSSSQDDTQSEPEQQMTYDFSIPTAEYTWDVNAGDPNVSAEMGGPGFTGEGWETQTTIHLSANPESQSHHYNN